MIRGCETTVKERLLKAKRKGFVASMRGEPIESCPYESRHGNSVMYRNQWLKGHAMAKKGWALRDL